MAGLIDDYLTSLRPYLRGTGRTGRRLVTEAEAHLRESTDELARSGDSDAEVEQQAITHFGAVDVVGPELRAAASRRLVNRHAVQSAIILPLAAALAALYAWAAAQSVISHGAGLPALPVATIGAAVVVLAVAAHTALRRRSTSLERTARRNRALGFLGVALLALHIGTAVTTFAYVHARPTPQTRAPATWSPPAGCPDKATLDRLNARAGGSAEPLQPLEQLLWQHCYAEPWVQAFGQDFARVMGPGLSDAFELAFIAAAGIISGLVLAIALVGTAVPAWRDRRRLAGLALA